jgi:predicted dienelactone hydrolase
MNCGSRNLTLKDPLLSVDFPALVFYPTDAKEQPISFGPYSVSAAVDAPVVGKSLPLIVISHGTGGSHLVYRETAAFLARNGFVVAQPEHPFNNRIDNSWDDRFENLVERPKTISKVINAIANDERFSVNGAQSAIIGHSMGGYTALAVAGGKPMAFARNTEDHVERAVPIVKDERVRAIVLLAPATPWFRQERSLSDITIPILMFTGEQDQITGQWHADIVKKNLSSAANLDHRSIKNAAHFSFLTPFPDAMKRPGFAPAFDPEGFDRVAFQAEMNSQILTFLKRLLI